MKFMVKLGIEPMLFGEEHHLFVVLFVFWGSIKCNKVYRLQDPMEATHPLHHPSLLLGHKQHHGVHGQAGRPSLLNWVNAQPRDGPLGLLQRIH